MARFLRRSGVYSATSVLRLGNSAPMATPVTPRSRIKGSTLVTAAVASVLRPSTAVARMIIRRRPMRSAAGPSSSEPTVMPSRPLLNTMPSVRGSSCHALASVGAAKEMASRSKPSRMLTSQHRPTTCHCRRLNGCASSCACSDREVSVIVVLGQSAAISTSADARHSREKAPRIVPRFVQAGRREATLKRTGYALANGRGRYWTPDSRRDGPT